MDIFCVLYCVLQCFFYVSIDISIDNLQSIFQSKLCGQFLKSLCFLKFHKNVKNTYCLIKPTFFSRTFMDSYSFAASYRKFGLAAGGFENYQRLFSKENMLLGTGQLSTFSIDN